MPPVRGPIRSNQTYRHGVHWGGVPTQAALFCGLDAGRHASTGIVLLRCELLESAHTPERRQRQVNVVMTLGRDSNGPAIRYLDRGHGAGATVSLPAGHGLTPIQGVGCKGRPGVCHGRNRNLFLCSQTGPTGPVENPTLAA